MVRPPWLDRRTDEPFSHRWLPHRLGGTSLGLLDGELLEGLWFDRTREHMARRRGIALRLEFATPTRCPIGTYRARHSSFDSAGGIADNTDVRRWRVVLDTNVVVAALRSRRGASFQLLSLLEMNRYEVALSVPLLFEYEDALVRHVEALLYTQEEVTAFLDFICQVGHRQTIFFLWRPHLQDPADDMVLELAVAAGCRAIVTHNRRDFVGAEAFDIQIQSPKEFLATLKEFP